jgi:hypothetical protein
LSHCQHEKEQAQQQHGDYPLATKGVAQLSVCQILQATISSAETVHTDNGDLCKSLAEEVHSLR